MRCNVEMVLQRDGCEPVLGGKPVEICAPLAFQRFAGHILGMNANGHYGRRDVHEFMAGTRDAQVPIPVPVEGQSLVEVTKCCMEVAAIDGGRNQDRIVAQQ